MSEAARRARGAADPGRRAGGRALARAPARGLRARARTSRSPTGPTARGPTPPRPCGSSSSAGSPRSRPTARRARRAAEPERERALPVAALIGRRGLLHRRERLHLARAPGRRFRSATSPMRRTACSRSTCCARATRRRIVPAAAVLHSHDYSALAAAAPELRRVARACARSTAGASPPRRAARCGQLRGELGPRAARAAPRGGARARRRRRRSQR